MDALASYSLLARRSRWVKSRGTIALLILAPFLAVAVCSTPREATAASVEWPVEVTAWCSFVGGVGFRFWAAIYIGGRKGQTLATDGPYSVCRNPLYFGSLLLLASFVTSVQSLTLVAGALAASAVYLGMTIHDEERRLEQKFGPAYVVYCRETPRLIPRWSSLRTRERVEVNLPALARECRSASLYLWLPIVARLLVQLRESRLLPVIADLP